MNSGQETGIEIMSLNRLIAKQVDLLKFTKLPDTKKKVRKEKQDFILDYLLIGFIFMVIILLILFFALGFIL